MLEEQPMATANKKRARTSPQKLAQVRKAIIRRVGELPGRSIPITTMGEQMGVKPYVISGQIRALREKGYLWHPDHKPKTNYLTEKKGRRFYNSLSPPTATGSPHAPPENKATPPIDWLWRAYDSYFMHKAKTANGSPLAYYNDITEFIKWLPINQLGEKSNEQH